MNKSLQKVVNKVMGRIAPKKGYNVEGQIAKQVNAGHKKVKNCK